MKGKYMNKPKYLETKQVDIAQCPWCGKTFNGDSEINYELGQEKRHKVSTLW
jgi:hypothetical protein